MLAYPDLRDCEKRRMHSVPGPNFGTVSSDTYGRIWNIGD
jgi:hypothetical protein